MWEKLKQQLKEAGIQKELEEELRSGWALHLRVAEREQAKIAAANRRNPRRGMEGLGQVTLSMAPFYRALADIRFGKNWQKDPATVRRLLQENPEFSVPYAAKAMVTNNFAGRGAASLKSGSLGGKGDGHECTSAPRPRNSTGGLITA